MRTSAQALVWRETTVFLFESLGLVSSILPQRLIQRLHGWPKRSADWPDLELPADGAITKDCRWDKWAINSGVGERVPFLAKLSVNPRVTLDYATRQKLWRRCWRWYYSYLLSEQSFGSFLISASQSVPGVLLSRRYYAQAALSFGIDVLNQFPQLRLSYCSAIVDLNALASAVHLASCSISGCSGCRGRNKSGMETEQKWNE